MAISGFTLFDRWVNVNQHDAGGNILVDDIYAVICGSGQTLSRSFVGSSADCRYSDLTAELATANGYTAGGIILPGKTVTLISGWQVVKGEPLTWTITSPYTGAKYVVLRAFESTNNDLIGFYDLDDSGGTVTLNTGSLIITPNANGIWRWQAP